MIYEGIDYAIRAALGQNEWVLLIKDITVIEASLRVRRPVSG
jgi:hypothetical protein